MKNMKFSLRLLLIVTAILSVVVFFNAERISSWFDNDKSNLMSLKQFWRIIDDSWVNAISNYEFRENLTEELEQLSERDLQRFNNRYRDRYYLAYDHRLWDAIYLINGGCGDDSFMDFRDYLISRGRTIYDRTLNDPETLLDDRLSGGEWPYSEEHFGSIADKIAESKNFNLGVSAFRRSKPRGQPINVDDELEIKRHYPRIYLHWKSENEKLAARRKAREAAKEKAEQLDDNFRTMPFLD